MITIIHGGHREGLCFAAYTMLIKLLDKKDIEVKAFSLRDHNIFFCCGNQPCQRLGVCVHKDTMVNEIIPAIAASDVVFFFSPTYFNMPPAILKNFMDRCNLLLTIAKRKHPKYGTWISGQTDDGSLDDFYNCLKAFAEICEFEEMNSWHIRRFEENVTTKQLNEHDLSRLIKLADEIS